MLTWSQKIIVSPTIQNEKTKRKIQHREENANVSNRIFKMGDNIVNHIRGYKLSCKVENYKVYAKSFSGVKMLYMEDYVKPTPGEMPTYIILHPGTNGLPTKKDPDRIVECM